jgi:magnesium transporter
MNFAFMPELGWRWGYFGILLVMAVVAAVMMVYFRRKRWL